jgi:AraC-like DNA-binding protein
VEFEFIEHMGGMDIRMFIVTIYKRQTHFHSDIEILLPLEGSVMIDVSTRRSVVEAGEFFIVNRNEAHSLVRTEHPNVLLVLQFSPNFSKDYYPQLSRIRIRQHHIVPKWMPKLHQELKAAFAFMLRWMGEKREGYQLALMSGLNAVACAIVRHGVYENQSAEKPTGEEKTRARLTSIVDYIQKNYTHNVSLAELSKAENMDMTYLSHFIKKQLGISFREYVNRLRLERAVDLVTNTRMRMIDVCVDCGYSDYRYLNKAFLQQFGMTPAQLREKGLVSRPLIFSDSDPEGAGEHSYMNLVAVYQRVLEQLEAPDISSQIHPFFQKITK